MVSLSRQNPLQTINVASRDPICEHAVHEAHDNSLLLKTLRITSTAQVADQGGF